MSFVISLAKGGLLGLGLAIAVIGWSIALKFAWQVLKYIAGCIGLLGVKIYNLGKCNGSS